MSDNPTTTGEWTVDWLYEYARQREGYKTICELHNAEREKFKQEYELHLATIEYTADLREQLAAERKKLAKVAVDTAVLESQLAAAVEALNKTRLLIEACVHGEALMSEVVATIDAALARIAGK